MELKTVRRSAALLSALCATSLAITACASSGGGSSSGGSKSTSAANACSSLNGKKISLTVPADPGNGYDLEARTIAPYLGKQLGATVVVKNQPAAGGLVAYNNLVKAKPDGTSLDLMGGTGAAAAVLAGSPGVNFKMTDFTYLGGLDALPIVVVSGTKSKYKTWSDVSKTPGFRFGGVGPGASNVITPTVLNSALNLHASIKTGFDSAGAIQLAIAQGTVDGVTGDPSVYLPKVQSGELQPLLIVGSERYSAYPDTPAVTELSMSDDQRQIIDAYIKLIAFGRSFIGPKGMSDATATCLQDAIKKVTERPSYIAEIKAQKRPLVYTSAADLEKLASEVSEAPSSLVDLLKQAS